MLESLVKLVIYLIVIGCIFGLLLYLVRISPVPEPYKQWLHFLVLAILIIVIIYILLGMVSGGGLRMPRLGMLEYPMLT